MHACASFSDDLKRCNEIRLPITNGARKVRMSNSVLAVLTGAAMRGHD
jgi:hypothetical protein